MPAARYRKQPRVVCSGTPVRLLSEREIDEFFAGITRIVNQRRPLVVVISGVPEIIRHHTP